MKTVVGMFNSASEAQRTIEELGQLGFGAKDISVVTNGTGQRALGGINLSTLDVADLGKVAACGPIADTLRRRDAPSGLSATLQYYGLSPKLADHYALGVQQGETLETLTVEDRDADRVVAVMEKHARLEREAWERTRSIRDAELAKKAEPIKAAPPPPPPPVPVPVKTEPIRTAVRGHDFGADEERRIPILREELRVGKREVERGGVQVSVHVKETPVSEKINLREEHIEVERHLMDRAPRSTETFFRDGEQFQFDEYAEEPYVTKDVRVVEEVVVHKRVSGHEETISDTLRATEVDIEKNRGLFHDDYKRHFSSQNISGGRFEEHLPAYELGHSLRGQRGARWEDIESSARERWEAKRPGTWQHFKDSVRYAWQRAKGD